jgi:hypothetical protein
MALESDSILGPLYLSPDEFTSRAVVFGVRVALPTDSSLTKAALAAASRAIEAVTGRSFLPDDITETHRFDPATRRVSVNQPPVLSLTAFRLVIGPTMKSDVNTSAVYVNNQENYLELVSFAQAVMLTPELITLGLTEIQAEVVYKSYQSVPENIAAACGFTAGKILNEMYTSSQVPDGITRVKLGNALDVQRRADADDAGLVPPIAKLLLAPYKRIAVG